MPAACCLVLSLDGHFTIQAIPWGRERAAPTRSLPATNYRILRRQIRNDTEESYTDNSRLDSTGT